MTHAFHAAIQNVVNLTKETIILFQQLHNSADEPLMGRRPMRVSRSFQIYQPALEQIGRKLNHER